MMHPEHTPDPGHLLDMPKAPVGTSGDSVAYAVERRIDTCASPTRHV
jgi:hypothetical protein